MKKVPIHTFEHTISLGNLLEAWQEFLHGKRNKPDVQEFQSMLMDNLISLQEDLRNRTYHHGPYQHFKIADPKPRDIHKASVRDRLLHHAHIEYCIRILKRCLCTVYILRAWKRGHTRHSTDLDFLSIAHPAHIPAPFGRSNARS